FCVTISSHVDLFFFSSRRRHTRFSRDWSSDVCSSDLNFAVIMAARNFVQLLPIDNDSVALFNIRQCFGILNDFPGMSGYAVLLRSEERRVGKECRSRKWVSDYSEK